jgi:hypothetical protein
LAPVADSGNAKLPKIFRGEMAQYFHANAILAECRLILLRPRFRSQLPTSTAASSGSVMLISDYRHFFRVKSMDFRSVVKRRVRRKKVLYRLDLRRQTNCK